MVHLPVGELTALNLSSAYSPSIVSIAKGSAEAAIDEVEKDVTTSGAVINTTPRHLQIITQICLLVH